MTIWQRRASTLKGRIFALAERQKLAYLAGTITDLANHLPNHWFEIHWFVSFGNARWQRGVLLSVSGSAIRLVDQQTLPCLFYCEACVFHGFLMNSRINDGAHSRIGTRRWKAKHTTKNPNLWKFGRCESRRPRHTPIITVKMGSAQGFVVTRSASDSHLAPLCLSHQVM